MSVSDRIEITLERIRVGSELKARRKRLKLTQTEIAELSGLTQKQVWSIEKGASSYTQDSFIAYDLALKQIERGKFFCLKSKFYVVYIKSMYNLRIESARKSIIRMKEYTKKVWQCDYCNRVSTSKSGINRHEIACNKNPQNIRICQGCNHLKMVERHYYFDTPQGEYCRIVNVLICQKLNEYKYPPKIERNQGGYDFGDLINTSMPFECEHFTSTTFGYL